MSTTTPIGQARTASAEDRRAARLARVKATRATRPAMVTLEVAASDVVAGDWLDRVPTQDGVRGGIIRRTVQAVTVTHDEWGQRRQGRRRMVPVEGRTFTFNAGDAAISCPAAFTVIVRRAVS